ncbi:hypothetical protein ABZT03_43160 [Streptomyces sp. NPDC005574]|uniref:hypothetical protein n=1 Tax=Streptomyces sp. NPDC005574 TaxID=3156891 RepID=UPI0033AC4BDC
MTERLTVNSINSDGLDALYDRLEHAEATVERVRALRDRWLLTTLEPGQVRRLLDGITEILNQTETP